MAGNGNGTNGFANVPIFSPEMPPDVPAQGGGNAIMAAPPQSDSALVSVEQSRAVAEVQAAVFMAKQFPRNEAQSAVKIKQACARPTLAEQAVYSFPRGRERVTGPSIRLAEVLARCWGNINFGFRELGRRGNVSEVEAYAIDYESNTRVTRQFQVKHWRDTKQGGYEIKEERDKYELIANMAQRRVRACLLELIPGDYVDMAVQWCNKTLTDAMGKRPIQDVVRDMAIAFDEIGVTVEMLEAHLGHKLDAVTPQQIVKLKQVYKSINDGVAGREEFFGVAPAKAPKPTPEPPKEQPAPKPAPKKKAEATPTEEDPAVGVVSCPKLEGKEVSAPVCASCEERTGCPAHE